MLGRPQGQSGPFGEENKLLSVPGLGLGLPSPQPYHCTYYTILALQDTVYLNQINSCMNMATKMLTTSKFQYGLYVPIFPLL